MTEASFEPGPLNPEFYALPLRHSGWAQYGCESLQYAKDSSRKHFLEHSRSRQKLLTRHFCPLAHCLMGMALPVSRQISRLGVLMSTVPAFLNTLISVGACLP